MTSTQLREVGVSARQVERGVRRGELRRLHRGVYLMGPITPRHAREMAAVLACGEGATISHRAATHLYEVLPYPAILAPVDVTVSGRRLAGDRRIGIHTAPLAGHEIRERHGIPVTSPARTLIDFAGQAAPGELEAAVAEAFALRLTNRNQLLKELDRASRRRGVAALRGLLDAAPGPARTRSRHERRFLALIRTAGLPDPEVNARVGGWEVDFLWREEQLVVEVDAYSTHSSPTAFERDRRKTAELEDLGHTVHRVTPPRFQAELARIRRAL